MRMAKIKLFSTSNRQTDVSSISLIGHAWHLLADNLNNDLSLEGWNSVSIKGRNKCVTIYAFGLNIILIISIQAPVFALTEGPAEIVTQTTTGDEIVTKILPTFPGYSLQFVQRDLEFEQLANQDASLMYAYVPNDNAKKTIWISLEIATTKSSLHRWETCLITWQIRQNKDARVDQIALEDVSLSQNPPIVGRYFVFKWYRKHYY